MPLCHFCNMTSLELSCIDIISAAHPSFSDVFQDTIKPFEELISSFNQNYLLPYTGRPRTIKLINQHLLSIRPPHHFTRLPRTLHERCYWKAHEWRNWLLFYCLPCCRHVLPQRYLRHFSLLSEAIFVLLLQELSPDQIDCAGKGTLIIFCIS